MELRGALARVFRDAIAACDPRAATCRALARAEVVAALAGRAVTVVAIGKAAVGMAAGARDALGARLVGGLVVAPAGSPADAAAAGLAQRRASHPVPDAASEAAGRAALVLAAGVPHDGVLLALISGGASALAAVPAPGLSLADKIARTSALAARGAPIAELNALRASLSAIKGGRLAAACAAPVVTLVASDVVGDALAHVGSGPTLGPARGGRPDDVAVLTGGVATLAQATAIAAAAVLPGEVAVVDARLEGDVVDVAARLAAGIAGASGPRTLIWAGETTIALPARPGRGGRARHLALLVARALAGRPGWGLLVAGSDGIDGTDDAAGAIVDGDTWAALAAAGIDGDAALAACDAGAALAGVAAALVTGPTGVNHADVLIAHVRDAAC